MIFFDKIMPIMTFMSHDHVTKKDSHFGNLHPFSTLYSIIFTRHVSSIP